MSKPDPTPFSNSGRPAPRNYFSRREQYRLLVLVGVLCGVVWAMNEARKPENWYWLTGTPEEMTAEEDLSAEPPGGFNTRLADNGTKQPLSPDVFEMPSEGPPEGVELEGDFFPGVRPDFVGAVVDDRPINRGSEYHAFYHLLALLEATPLAELEQASQGEAGFRQLFEQTEEYRGQLVTVNGIVHMVTEEEAPPGNEYGVEKYYRLWMEPVGGPREVITAIFLELPEGFPTEEAAVDAEPPRIQFTGFFYKREPYQSNDSAYAGLRTAPLLLAKTPHWIPPPPPRTPVQFKPVIFGLAVGATLVVAISLAGAAWYYTRRKSPQAEKYSVTGRVRGEDIARPTDEEVLPSPSESLARLAEAESNAASDDPQGPTFP